MNSARHPILVDTSGLIAVGMSSQWETAKASLKLTTTNVCLKELQRHIRETPDYAPKGSRDHRLHEGSKQAVAAFDDDESEFTVVTVVPTPTGEDAGDESLVEELSQNPAAYRYVVLNDATYRDRLRAYRDRNELSYTVVPPTFLLYVLYDTGKVTKAEFCRACAEIMRGEGWTNAGAVHEMWREIPVDCSPYVDESLLPE